MNDSALENARAGLYNKPTKKSFLFSIFKKTKEVSVRKTKEKEADFKCKSLFAWITLVIKEKDHSSSGSTSLTITRDLSTGCFFILFCCIVVLATIQKQNVVQIRKKLTFATT